MVDILVWIVVGIIVGIVDIKLVGIVVTMVFGIVVKIDVGIEVGIVIGIVVDIDIINKSPEVLLYAGVADIVSNLSAIQDWLLAHNEIGEPINELSYMLAKEAALPLLRYKKEDLHSDGLILDLVNGIVTS